MNDNISAFNSDEYDDKIRKTLPYYDEFYKQAIDVVRCCTSGRLDWLDAGCGTGKMAEMALAELEIGRFVFCDCSASMLDTARSRFKRPDAEFRLCTVQDLNYSEIFDVVTSIQVNHYLKAEERIEAAGKYYQALKPGGIFISFENYAPYTSEGVRLALDRWSGYQHRQGKSLQECAEHIGRYNKEYFPVTLARQMDILRGCGFKTVEMLWLSYMQAGFYAIKEE